MNEHEKEMVETFIVKEKRARYYLIMGNPKKRARFLGPLNHNLDLDECYMQELLGNADVPSIPRKHGSLEEVMLLRTK